MLARIAALLLAMADLAERSALASGPVRRLVLWALYRADAVAKEFLAETTTAQGWLWTPAVLSVGNGSEPADAMDLATSLRTLALVMQTMAALLFDPAFAGFGEACWHGGNIGFPHDIVDRDVADRPGAAALPERCDTS